MNHYESRQQLQQVTFQFSSCIQPEGMIINVQAFREDKNKRIVFIILNIITFGIIYLLSRWYTSVWAKLRMQRCDYDIADYFLVLSQDNTETIVKATRLYANLTGEHRFYTILEYRFYRYYFDGHSNQFVTLDFDLNGVTHENILEQNQGVYTEEIAYKKKERYGINSTDLPKQSLVKILIDEVLSPFYVFQLFSVILWFTEGYVEYSIIIFLMSIFSTIDALYEYNKNFNKLQALARNESMVYVIRSIDCVSFKNIVEVNSEALRKSMLISSRDLVPGDLIIIEDGQNAPCDIILLNGQCIINESMLTGESVPVMKTSIQRNKLRYNALEESRQHTIFAGTQCIETKVLHKGQIPLVGLVSQIGFNTQKGQLIRSIMFTQQSSFQFYEDSIKFILTMAILAIIGFIITIQPNLDMFELLGIPLFPRLIQNIFDLVTITIPPALPTSLQVGISIGLYRLKQNGVFCICPQKINTAGKITVMCFDKTGTITEEGLDFYGVRFVGYNIKQKNLVLKCLQKNPYQQEIIDESIIDEIQIHSIGNELPIQLPVSKLIYEVMSSCHSLGVLDGKIIGDPLDQKLFDVTKCTLDAREDEQFLQLILLPDQNQEDISPSEHFPPGSVRILKRFDFSSNLQRVSVVISNDNNQRIYTKGSPEKLRELCIPSTIPATFPQVLEFYAQNGFRVLCCAAKTCDYSNQDLITLSRDEVEQGLTFLGFLILENKLKPITITVIDHLNKANIRSLMVTGDNILTAVSVARSCNMIREQQKVFVGELINKNGKQKIKWNDFSGSQQRLDSELQPKLISVPSLKDAHLSQQFIQEGYQIFLGKSQASLDLQIREASIRNIDEQFDHLEESEYEQSYKEEVPLWMSMKEDIVLAITGPAFTYLLTNQRQILRKLVEKCQVYARMRPDEKSQLIRILKTHLDRQPLVGFCGDGANDCGALKTSDLGISLSQAEASIAAPFTSQTQDISCVPVILSEGRAALVCSFTCFKFMMMYSVVQFTTTCILQFAFSSLTDQQYLYIDLGIIIPLSMTMGFTNARRTLNKYVPKGSLISTPVISSVMGQFIIQAGFQLLVYRILLNQPWFISSKGLNYPSMDESDYYRCFESTTLFLFSNFQYLFTVLAFSTGKPFRQPFYQNFWFTVSIVAILITQLTFLYSRTFSSNIGPLGIFFGDSQHQMPDKWIFYLTLLIALNGLVTIMYERSGVPKITRFCDNLNQKYKLW